MSTPAYKDRVRLVNDAPVREDGDFVLYWMTAHRRPKYNHSLDVAVAYSKKLQKPLLVLEAVRTDYRWASDRLHAFLLQGMADNKKAFGKSGIAYYPYVEHKPGEGSGLLYRLCERACVLVSDDFPAFFLPQMMAKVAPKVPVRFGLVDSNGLFPIRLADKEYPSAYAFRRMLQKQLPPYLDLFPSSQVPKAEHLRGARVPSEIARRYPAASDKLLEATSGALSAIAIDHDVGPSPHLHGGFVAGGKHLRTFLDERLERYGEDRNHPDLDGQSGLSPWLHFGHVSAFELFDGLREREDWSRNHVSPRASGMREGFWGMSKPAEAFLDEFVTWRELGDNTCVHRPDTYDRYDSLPDWAKKTLAEHQDDPREYVYSHEQLDAAETHDEVWNAAQRQIRRTGSLHNYMRMLWGKRVIAWSKRPQDAHKVLIDLNNRYGVDGRDSNSWAGIMWCFGRYDRPWPEHDVFGKVRMMTSASTKRKLKIKRYLEEFGQD
jgi:deoxyribodipyrimidine photo-lyase